MTDYAQMIEEMLQDVDGFGGVQAVTAPAFYGAREHYTIISHSAKDHFDRLWKLLHGENGLVSDRGMEIMIRINQHFYNEYYTRIFAANPGEMLTEKQRAHMFDREDKHVKREVIKDA